MLRSLLASWWREPRAPGAPHRVWRDWVLVGLLEAAALLEGLLRPDVVWRPFATAAALALVPALLVRRTRPLLAVVLVFGAYVVLIVAGLVADAGEPVGLYTNAFALLLPYSLVRWGSGREMGLGLGVVLATSVLAIAADWTGVVDAVVGMVIVSFPAALGAAVRSWHTSRSRELAQVKTSEREQLARELHDTVAHHVSAIAVRAQAGRAVAEHSPAAALEALDVIELEASRTLEELRSMVGLLRRDGHAELAPQRGVHDIPALRRADDRCAVHVDLSGDLDDLPPHVEAALYRIAQESLTNALQHARDATRVDLCVTGGRDAVRLSVRDDGQPPAARGATGFGLVGMTERAVLLGGSLHAGPHPGGGWGVEAVIPREALR